MSRALGMLLLLAIVFVGGVLWLFGVQFEAGSGYPVYSSLRRDAAGTRILYESLATLPGLRVERSELPLEWLRVEDATVLVLGVEPTFSQEQSDRFADAVEDLARRGNRVVIAFTRPANDSDKPAQEAITKRPLTPLEKRWKLDPDRLEPVEVDFAGDTAAGSVLVAPDAAAFRNASLAGVWSPRTIAGYLGNHNRVVFDESHLGLVESGSIVGLARRYRLQGFVFGTALVVALFLWRSMSPFPSPAPATSQGIVGRASAAGLAALLSQNVTPQQFVPAAWSAWVKGRPTVPSTRRRDAEMLVQNGDSPDPLETLAKIHASLQTPRRPRNP